MKKSELMKTAHEIAKNIKIEGSYHLKLSIGMKIAYKLNRIFNRIGDNLDGYHVCINADASIDIYIAPESIGNNSIFGQFVGELTKKFHVDTESEKFTRLAIQKLNAA